MAPHENRPAAEGPVHGYGAPAAGPGTRAKLVLVLMAGQILGGLGIGAALSVGALMAHSVTGSVELSGMAATLTTLGAALAAVPLAALARARGRSPSLAVGSATAAFGAILAVVASSTNSPFLLFAGFLLLGVASAVGLQGRFAAADAALPHRRGLMLSLVMWATTIGSVTGPLLIGPTAPLAEKFGLPELAGPFLITVAAQLAASALYAFGLRPDPLTVATATDAAEAADTGYGPEAAYGSGGTPSASTASASTPSASTPAATTRGTGVEHRPAGRAQRARRNPAVPLAQLAIAVGHFVMVLIMAMTPVHLQGIGAPAPFIGIAMSLHIAGMWALTPLFGWLADLVGPRAIVLTGQTLLLATAAIIVTAPDDAKVLAAALALLGLGWSATVVAGSAIVTKAVATGERTQVQGRTDLAMNLGGVLGGLVGGPILGLVGFPALALVALVPVAVVVATQMTRAARAAG